MAHGLGLLGACIVTGGLLGLAFHVRRSQPGLGLVGGALCVVGAIGLGAGFAIDGFTWGILGAVSTDHRSAPGSAEFTLHTVQHSRWLIPYYGLIALWVAGVLALAIGALRTTPRWAAGLLGLGAILTVIEGAVAAQLVLHRLRGRAAAGGAAVAAAIARMDDRAFAGA